MKNTLKNNRYFALVGALAIPAGLVWYEAKAHPQTVAPAVASPTVASPTMASPRISLSASLQPPSIAPPQPVAVAVIIPSTQPSPVVDTVGRDGILRHIAQPGETVSSMATDILGRDSKANRDSIINANASLRADPDKLVAGKSYHIPAAGEVPATVTPAPSAAIPPVERAASVSTAPSKGLKYTAEPGDTVEKLAGAFLGNDDQAHQDKITDANPSLQNNPDRLIAGKTYRIPAPDGLSAAPAEPSLHPTTQPDADQVISDSAPRMLRYTAVAGDSVTTLAIKLLGSDTQEARNTIIFNNPSLKRDPDRLIAGHTYSIPAPVAEVKTP
jgi:hypothetical protein